ncbi:nitroreductase family deazaflavin-dependent oxidoreductase [Gordonia sp. HY285]|uniref:nitroreductase family deazaflavin-dependent oxidoreductase n=1 Tax=Gordonia liuliyuniae TaxID=2911517 RepID=UPI001F0147A3|nr:nitroreductase family deazaflavin-dependent oxidoreductase [Gordonia liuliyuniae]MCF8610302.1 nitroreductase family deazaflavin-dependent oxidoreductase [Gordonia liuliyuniae]
MNDTTAADRYIEPTGRLGFALNKLVGSLARIGFAPSGCYDLQVPGRVSGELRTTPVNVLDLDGVRYLVSARGRTQWVRNVRAGGEVTLRRGRRSEAVTLVELDDDRKPELIRAYLTRWAWQVAAFDEGLAPDSTDAEILDAAPGMPVFEVR